MSAPAQQGPDGQGRGDFSTAVASSVAGCGGGLVAPRLTPHAPAPPPPPRPARGGGGGGGRVAPGLPAIARSRHPDRDARIAAMYLDGAEMPAIAAATGLGLGAVKAVIRTLRQRGVDLPVRIDQAVVEARRQRVLDMFRQGQTYGQIATTLGIGRGSVSNYLHCSRAKAPGHVPRRVMTPAETLALRDTVVAGHLQGRSVAQMARETGHDPKHVSGQVARARALGLLPPAQRRTKAEVAALAKTILAMRADGKLAAEIGAAVGMTKDAVLGMIHRLRGTGVDVPAAPVFRGPGRVQAPRPERRPSSPPAPRAAATPAPRPPASSMRFGNAPALVALPRNLGPPPKPTSPHRVCQFIADDPALHRQAPAPVCGAPTLPGRSWCARCCAVVFRPERSAA